MKTLLLLRGVAGAGKSTLASAIAAVGTSSIYSQRVAICEADDYFYDDDLQYCFDANELPAAHNYCKAKVMQAMDDGMPMVIVANTSTREWEMKPYETLAARYGYQVFHVIVENRHENDSVHDVPVYVLDNQVSRFQIQLHPSYRGGNYALDSKEES